MRVSAGAAQDERIGNRLQIAKHTARPRFTPISPRRRERAVRGRRARRQIRLEPRDDEARVKDKTRICWMEPGGQIGQSVQCLRERQFGVAVVLRRTR